MYPKKGSRLVVDVDVCPTVDMEGDRRGQRCLVDWNEERSGRGGHGRESRS